MMTNHNRIGVICSVNEVAWVAEFFQFFKTPWEFWREGQTYSVVVTTRPDLERIRAKLIVVYSSDDPARGRELAGDWHEIFFKSTNLLLPIYGPIRTLESPSHLVLAVLKSSCQAVVAREQRSHATVVRAGYDLFHELRIVLSTGQPAANALIPTIDIHVSMLRNWILSAGIPLVEVPPAPHGYDFITCLTHDVDFIRIRDHKLDHTLLGFLYRSSVGSLRDLMKRRISWRHFLKNVTALASLPAVYLGLREDFWLQDFERFAAVERGLKSTFFFIPFKNRPGDKVDRKHATRRSAMYEVAQEQTLLQSLKDAGNEIGVHGIDAWHDPEKGREERRKIAALTGKSNLGIRIHWLCFDATTPHVLDDAGFQFDSTIGYNDTVGYKAGTSQVFRPVGARNLLELPLHIQDSALFYPGYLGLPPNGAWKVCEGLIRNAVAHGGVLTVLWHTRSLAPERQWGDFYIRLLQGIREHKVWFATAGEAVQWFRRRREFSFDEVPLRGDGAGLILRTYLPRDSWDSPQGLRFVDSTVTAEEDTWRVFA